MFFQKKIVAIIALIGIFALVNPVIAQDDFWENLNNISQKRVIAHSQQEVKQALLMGCRLVKDIQVLTALNCPNQTAQALGLAEDIQVFAMDLEDIFAKSHRLKIQSALANQQIGANTVHTDGNTGSDRKVVILDTGYNYLHPELASSYLGGKDFVNNDADPMDDQGHGSHVAGIITADGLNPTAKGVAPDAGIIVGKVLDENGSGYFSDVVEGIYWAVNGPDGIYGTGDDFGADAINISLGTGFPYLYRGYCDSAMPDLTLAIQYAVSKNVAVAVAAGNSGTRGISIPGCISYSTTVGAVDSRDRVASFSGRGNALDIVAPGVNIFSTILDDSYATWSGTSMATPVIAGVIALMKFSHPEYIHSQMESALFDTTKDLGKSGKDKDYGWGRVRADLAVK